MDAASSPSQLSSFRISAQLSDYRIHLMVLAIVLISEWIGNVTLSLGAVKITLFPLLWALILGILVSTIGSRLPGLLQLGQGGRAKSASIIQIAVFLFISKLGLIVGQSLPKLYEAGWVIFFQEAGHFIGTIIVALPIALLLGVKREAVGATFSIGREPSIAIIAERYGIRSPEGHGVLAEYITGTLVGALFIAVFASLLKATGLFDPLALAMGAGSMMAAASSAIAAGEPPELAKQIAAFAAASNLLTTTLGTYVTLFISLPVANWVYNRLEPYLSPRSVRGARSFGDVEIEGADAEARLVPTIPSWSLKLSALFVGAAIALVAGNWLTYGTVPRDALVGMLIIIAVAVLGDVIAATTKHVLPAVCWISAIGMLLTAPFHPWATLIVRLTSTVNFLALATPILAYAGLSIAKDLPVLRRLGWRIIVTSLLANTGTFLLGALFAEIGLRH
jgi:Protein of unknown function (DUF3100)